MASGQDSIQNLLTEPQLKTLIGNFIKNNPDNPNVVELKKLDVNEDFLVKLGKAMGSKEGLGAVADYMENKQLFLNFLPEQRIGPLLLRIYIQ